VYSDLAQSARAVSADLGAIFPEAGSSAADTPRVAAAATPAPRVRGVTAGIIGVVLATGLSGVVAGALIARSPAPAAVVPAPRVTAPAPVPAAIVPAAPAPAPVVVVAQAPQAIAFPPAKTRRAPSRSPASASASASATIGGCGRLARGDRAWCAHRQVMVQDRTLRRAYARAARAGVPRATLAAYTRRWSSLRLQAVRDPARVAIGYAAMSRELSQKAQRQTGRR
jgi:hypothetical protein